jgi:hypothetical protein
VNDHRVFDISYFGVFRRFLSSRLDLSNETDSGAIWLASTLSEKKNIFHEIGSGGCSIVIPPLTPLRSHKKKMNAAAAGRVVDNTNIPSPSAVESLRSRRQNIMERLCMTGTLRTPQEREGSLSVQQLNCKTDTPRTSHSSPIKKNDATPKSRGSLESLWERSELLAAGDKDLSTPEFQKMLASQGQQESRVGSDGNVDPVARTLENITFDGDDDEDDQAISPPKRLVIEGSVNQNNALHPLRPRPITAKRTTLLP